MISIHKQLNKLKIKYGHTSIIVDESWNVLEILKDRSIGTGNYQNILFKCSKCGKSYDTFGALNFYHKKCNKDMG